MPHSPFTRIFPLLLLISVAIVSGCGESEADARYKAKQHLQRLLLISYNYSMDNNAWPSSLEDLQTYSGEEFDLVNPVTGSDPGYAIIAPENFMPERLNEPYSRIAVIVQLRDGKPDRTLAVGFLDMHVALPDANTIWADEVKQ